MNNRIDGAVDAEHSGILVNQWSRKIPILLMENWEKSELQVTSLKHLHACFLPEVRSLIMSIDTLEWNTCPLRNGCVEMDKITMKPHNQTQTHVCCNCIFDMS